MSFVYLVIHEKGDSRRVVHVTQIDSTGQDVGNIYQALSVEHGNLARRFPVGRYVYTSTFGGTYGKNSPEYACLAAKGKRTTVDELFGKPDKKPQKKKRKRS
jgi:hypothetical protein